MRDAPDLGRTLVLTGDIAPCGTVIDYKVVQESIKIGTGKTHRLLAHTLKERLLTQQATGAALLHRADEAPP